jgi:hypothetical protein
MYFFHINILFRRILGRSTISLAVDPEAFVLFLVATNDRFAVLERILGLGVLDIFGDIHFLPYQRIVSIKTRY